MCPILHEKRNPVIGSEEVLLCSDVICVIIIRPVGRGVRWVRPPPSPTNLGSPPIVKKKNYQNKSIKKEREMVFLCFDYLHSIWSFGFEVHHLYIRAVYFGPNCVIVG